MPIHLRAEAGDYAPAVLCPGDPLRAQYIADTFFDPGFRQVNAERGMLGFTGTFEGRPISVQSTGMGCPVPASCSRSSACSVPNGRRRRGFEPSIGLETL